MEKQLQSGNIGGLLTKFSIPAIIGAFFTSLYNIVDMIYVGNGVGSDGIAVLTICFPFMIVTTGFGVWVSGGGASLLSRALGAKDTQAVNYTVSNSIMLTMLLGIVLSAGAMGFSDALLRLMGSSERLLPLAKHYFFYSLIGNVYFPLVICLIFLLQAGGKPKASMVTMVSGCLLNLLLDPLFIFSFKMGVSGAALATSLSQGISLLTGIGFLFFDSKFVVIKLKPCVLKISIIKEVLGIGLAPFFSVLGTSLILVLANNLVGKYGGDLYLSIFGISTKLSMFFKLPINGLGQGMQPIAGYNFGSQNLRRVKDVFTLTLVISSLISIGVFIIVMVFPQHLLSVFTHEKSVIETGVIPLRLLMLSFGLSGILETGRTLFISIGKKFQSLIVSTFYKLFILVPLMIISPLYTGLNGVFLAFPISDMVGVVIIGILVFWEWKPVGTSCLGNSKINP